MYSRHDLVMAVKELLERHLDVNEIATKLCVGVDLVQQILNQI